MIKSTMDVKYSACLFADGRNRFYRSYLSILMQDLAALEIIISYDNPDNLGSMKIAQLAAEDDSNRAVPTTYLQAKKFQENDLAFNSEFIAPLNEGDFWLPTKNLEQSKKIDSTTSIISCTYYQRMKLGNSQIVKQPTQLHSSTLFLEKKEFQSEIFDLKKVYWINEPLTVVTVANANNIKKIMEF